MEINPASIWRKSKDWLDLIRDKNIVGIIESFTIINVAPAEFEENAPYAIALISLNNGGKIVAEVVGKESNIGMKVEPCIRRVHINGEDGLIQYGVKFRLIK